MTFDEFAEALQAEGFTRKDIESRAAGPVVFIRPLTGQVYCPRSHEIECRVSPNGYRGSPTWCGFGEALRAVKAREV